MMVQMTNDMKEILKKHGAVKASLFGSIARGDAKLDSDVDILVEFSKGKKLSLFDLVSIQGELEKKVGKKVDLVTKVNRFVEPYIKKDLIEIL